MVTLATAQNALRTVYLDVLSNQLNTNINPLFNKIKQTSKDIMGAEIKKIAPFGLNGGIGAGTEEGALPKAYGNNYTQFVSALKNLYGTIEISDKAVRSTSLNAGAFVNLLNDEMESLLKASSFNLARMLYGDGTGKLATVSSWASITQVATVDSARNIMEGMVVDLYTSAGVLVQEGLRIKSINRTNNGVSFVVDPTTAPASTNVLYMQGSKDKEITGLDRIFTPDTVLYGIDRLYNRWLNPTIKTYSNVSITEPLIQAVVDDAELVSGESPNFITASTGVRRIYQTYLGTNQRNAEIIMLENGVKAISFNGIPLVSDRFVPEGDLFVLNTDKFALHQLGDWKWLEGENGNILTQKPGHPTYSATLVKYAELICDKPLAQTKITGLLNS